MPHTSTSILPTRKVARLIVLDACDDVLLVRYREYRGDQAGSFWATPGGQLEDGEQPETAAIRELREETGLSAQIERPLWGRNCIFELPQGVVNQYEEYFLVRLSQIAPVVQNSSSEAICEHRWWSLAELKATSEVIYPDGLAADLQALLSGES